MSNISVFNFHSNNVRVIAKESQHWFVANDLCKVLGYSNPRDAISRHVDEVDVSDVVIHDGSQSRKVNALNESGMYSLILRSNLPKAKEFKRWVTSDVLPSIRKTGGYKLPANYSDALRELADTTDKLVETEEKLGEAIRTKAQIGSRREAQAMATASAARREVESLKSRLGESETWMQVTAIPWLAEEFDMKNQQVYAQIGRVLSRLSIEIDIHPILVPHQKYGNVKAYHKDVISCLKKQLKSNANLMIKFRKSQRSVSNVGR